MAGNANSGRRQEKPFRDALMLAIKARVDDEKGLRKIAENLLDAALANELPAIKELADRVDGKVPQAVIGGDEDDPAIQTVSKVIYEIVRTPNEGGSGI
jgi:hypothetical protein